MARQWRKRAVSALAGLAMALAVFVGQNLGVEAIGSHNVTQNHIKIFVDNAQAYINPTAGGVTVRDLDSNAIYVGLVEIYYNSAPEEWSIRIFPNQGDPTHRYTFDAIQLQFGNGYQLNFTDHSLVWDPSFEGLYASSNDNAGGGNGGGSSRSSGSGEGMHVHDMKWAIVVPPTFYEEGIQALQCADCGFIDKTSQQPVPRQSAIMAWNERLVMNAKAGETVVLDFFDHFSVNRYFIEKLMAHNDAAYEIHYRHNFVDYVIKVPVCFNWEQTLDANGWSGFPFVRTFPGVERISPAE